LSDAVGLLQLTKFKYALLNTNVWWENIIQAVAYKMWFNSPIFNYIWKKKIRIIIQEIITEKNVFLIFYFNIQICYGVEYE